MEPRNCLGIYLSKDRATVVCPGSQSGAGLSADCFTVSVQTPDEHVWHNLAKLIAQGCTDRKIKFSEVAVALDCVMFMQHGVHSEFKDPRKVAATARFDTEEALATDISGMAMAFRIASSDQTGSNLTVFTVQQKVLSDILLALQANGIDPVTVEPDVVSLSRYVCRNAASLKTLQGDVLFAILARSRGYLLGFSKAQEPKDLRTFLLGPVQNRTEVLARDIRITTALSQAGLVSCIKVFDADSGVNTQQLSEKMRVPVESFDMAVPGNASSQDSTQCPDAVDFAVAYGAILAHPDKSTTVNFRSDFLPYQGRKLRFQKALKLLSVSLTILLLSLGFFLQMELLKVNRNRDELRRKIEPDFLAVMMDGKKMTTLKDAVAGLGSLFRRIENDKKGLITDREAASAKLALLLEAFNSCAKPTDLNIDSISITSRDIVVVGDTSSRANTLRLLEALKKSGLDAIPQHLYPKGDRDNFYITMTPTKLSGTAQ